MQHSLELKYRSSGVYLSERGYRLVSLTSVLRALRLLGPRLSLAALPGPPPQPDPLIAPARGTWRIPSSPCTPTHLRHSTSGAGADSCKWCRERCSVWSSRGVVANGACHCEKLPLSTPQSKYSALWLCPSAHPPSIASKCDVNNSESRCPLRFCSSCRRLCSRITGSTLSRPAPRARDCEEALAPETRTPCWSRSFALSSATKSADKVSVKDILFPWLFVLDKTFLLPRLPSPSLCRHSSAECIWNKVSPRCARHCCLLSCIFRRLTASSKACIHDLSQFSASSASLSPVSDMPGRSSFSDGPS